MKKLTALLLAICASVSVFAFAACGDSQPAETNTTSESVDHNFQICAAYTATPDVITISSTSSLKDYMDALKEDGLIEFEGYDSDYGYYVTSVFGVSGTTISSTDNSWSGYSWMVYTTVTTIDGVAYSDTATGITYNGLEFYCSSYGVSYLPCIEGESYAFVYTFTSTSW